MQGDRSKKNPKNNKGDSGVAFHENVLPREKLVASSWNTSGSPEHRRSHHHQSSLIYFSSFYFSLLSSLLTPLTLFLSKSFTFLFIKLEADRHLLLLAMFWWDPLGMHFHLLTSAVYTPQHCRGARAWGSPSQQSLLLLVVVWKCLTVNELLDLILYTPVSQFVSNFSGIFLLVECKQLEHNLRTE